MGGADEILGIAGQNGVFELRAFSLRRSHERSALPLLCPLIVGDEHLFLATDHPGFHRAYWGIHLRGRDVVQLGEKYFDSLWGIAPYILRDPTGPRPKVIAKLRRRIAVVPSRDRAAAVASPTTRRATHSEDFTFVNWFGESYRFDDGQQAKAVGLLWAEWEKGGLGLSEKTIGERIGSGANNYRLVHTFRKTADRNASMHPAWGGMIQGSRGTYRLITPNSRQNNS
jgi:hypothetical protein